MHSIHNAIQVGGLLAGRRKQLELTQSDVASRLGISQNRLSELEAKPATMTVEQLLALVNVLGLDLKLGERTASDKTKVEW